MPHRKIATCCYCGTRAALVLRGTDRHELACSTCGAPLHDLKMLRSDHPEDRQLVKPSRVRKTSRKRQPDHKRRKRKKSRSFRDWVLEEAWDAIEDIFD